MGCKFPVTSRSPGPTATISPSFGSLVVSVGKNKPEDNCVSLGARFTNTRSASGCNLRNNACYYVMLCYVWYVDVNFCFVCKNVQFFSQPVSSELFYFNLIWFNFWYNDFISMDGLYWRREKFRNVKQAKRKHLVRKTDKKEEERE